MKTVKEIYSAYRIMPTLAAHQLRVAAVAALAADALRSSVEKEAVVTACLFHDMGNIIKSELDYFPDFTKPEGLDYWKSVQADYVKKYGTNEHEATLEIAKELLLPEAVRALIGGLGFSKMEEVVASPSMEMKLCEYADMRVGPFGIIPLDERLEEGRKRYANRREEKYFFASSDFERLSNATHALEEQIFSTATSKPEAITDASVEPLMKELEARLV